MLTSFSKVVVGFLWFCYMIGQIEYGEILGNGFGSIIDILTMILAWRLVRTGVIDMWKIVSFKVRKFWRRLRNKEVKSEE